jgi:hypothetical protein
LCPLELLSLSFWSFSLLSSTLTATAAANNDSVAEFLFLLCSASPDLANSNSIPLSSSSSFHRKKVGLSEDRTLDPFSDLNNFATFSSSAFCHI